MCIVVHIYHAQVVVPNFGQTMHCIYMSSLYIYLGPAVNCILWFADWLYMFYPHCLQPALPKTLNRMNRLLYCTMFLRVLPHCRHSFKTSMLPCSTEHLGSSTDYLTSTKHTFSTSSGQGMVIGHGRRKIITLPTLLGGFNPCEKY